MAIRIPSKNIYGSPENPKVRDNVIERIEVGAVEVVPNNEYETPVYNSQQIVDKSAMKAMSTIQRNTVGNVISYSGMGSGFSCNIASIEVFDIKTIHLSISIKKIQKNSLVSKIYYEKDNEGNNQIKYSIFGKTNKGTCSQSITWSPPSGVWVGEGKATFSNYGKISFTEDTIGEEENRIDLYVTRSYTKEKEYSNSAVTSNFTPQDVSNVTSFVELEDMYLIDIDFVVSMKVAKLGGFGDTIVNGGYNTTLAGTYEEYIPTQIEITVYGNTIGIDLTDNTVYINGKTAKKVHSVDGNELMQTSNYFLESGNSAITTMYGETATQYARGKETATIRCSISDYYQRITAKVVRYTEYSATNIVCYFDVGDENLASRLIGEYISINGIDGFVRDVDETQIMVSFTTNKVIPFLQDESVDLSLTAIAVDNSTNKMCFEIGDQVIPMVYGADGKDRPMSTYQNGSPKIFQVLGSKIFYDGAVWQELSLQEVDKSENL